MTGIIPGHDVKQTQNMISYNKSLLSCFASESTKLKSTCPKFSLQQIQKFDTEVNCLPQVQSYNHNPVKLTEYKNNKKMKTKTPQT